MLFSYYFYTKIFLCEVSYRSKIDCNSRLIVQDNSQRCERIKTSCEVELSSEKKKKMSTVVKEVIQISVPLTSVVVPRLNNIQNKKDVHKTHYLLH